MPERQLGTDDLLETERHISDQESELCLLLHCQPCKWHVRHDCSVSVKLHSSTVRVGRLYNMAHYLKTYLQVSLLGQHLQGVLKLSEIQPFRHTETKQ